MAVLLLLCVLPPPVCGAGVPIDGGGLAVTIPATLAPDDQILVTDAAGVTAAAGLSSFRSLTLANSTIGANGVVRITDSTVSSHVAISACSFVGPNATFSLENVTFPETASAPPFHAVRLLEGTTIAKDTTIVLRRVVFHTRLFKHTVNTALYIAPSTQFLGPATRVVLEDVSLLPAANTLISTRGFFFGSYPAHLTLRRVHVPRPIRCSHVLGVAAPPDGGAGTTRSAASLVMEDSALGVDTRIRVVVAPGATAPLVRLRNVSLNQSILVAGVAGAGGNATHGWRATADTPVVKPIVTQSDLHVQQWVHNG